jgi:hypothetical protein
VTSVQDGATPDLTESAPDLALSSQTADAPPSLPDASAAMDAEPLAPLQECTAEQKVSLTYAEAACIAIETVANVRSGLVCVARASDCDLCTGQLVR